MKLRAKCINTVVTVKGFGSITIEDNADRFEMYKNLGLDVFAKERKEPKPSKKAVDKSEEE